MIQVDTKLKGDLTADLDKYAKVIQEQVVFAGVAAMAKVMYDEARLNAEKHKKTGLLQSAIYRVFAKEISSADRKTYRISWNKSKAPHGYLIEFGTSKAPAYPFLRPAFDHIEQAIRTGRDAMSRKLREVT